ncbi:uncharacterized protein EDB93DRAFT_1103730 [Suillus bovinus]|uniref:uncharacterized protein n=1 Tax=Suillus bovinus TaxID=48563 RepID=UPI001B879635|nr:uncharacterized protein EDB93DRAFT_1103730 [Suillus bovinus]KAG2148674.1 hypothetical protein EDB93DRAFT_1103730 [Suillus bovinus]
MKTTSARLSPPPIVIQGHTIHPSKSHKVLGVIIDQDLNFKEHAAHAMEKGTKYVMACNHMIKPTKGIHGRLMNRLYKCVVLPKMLYAADIWCANLVSKGRGKKGGRGARGFASQMARVQRMATLNITGGLRSSASDMLDSHTNILPFQQVLCYMCYRATLRMSTLPESHPLSKHITAASNFCKKRNYEGHKRHPSPLHRLFNEFKTDPATMEKILPVRHSTKWEPDVTISIASKEKDAAREEEEASEDLRVYSDGLAIDGGVGGAAFLDNLRSLLPNEDGRKLTIQWTPGHKGIAGNEAADVQAKRAARGEASETAHLPRSLKGKA